MVVTYDVTIYLDIIIFICRPSAATTIKTASKCKLSRHQFTRGSSAFIRGAGTDTSQCELTSMDAELVSY